MPSFHINPRAFISPPFITCPSCGAETFGVLSIHGSHLTRKCRDCAHWENFPLPSITKKVIYLDQFFLSQMMKTLHPDHRDRAGHHEDFWREAFRKLDRRSKLQLIVCPSSSIHTDESRVSPYLPDLHRMYQLLSGGVSFRHHSEIESEQVYEPRAPESDVDYDRVFSRPTSPALRSSQGRRLAGSQYA